MRTLILLLIAFSATIRAQIPFNTTPPPTPCTVGQQYVWLNASDNRRMLFVCDSSGWQQQGNVGDVTAADLASPLVGKGANQVAYSSDGLTYRGRSIGSRTTLGWLFPQDYIAKECPDVNIADFASHPLSICFSTLADANAVYPKASTLTDELAWAALQLAVDRFDGRRILLPPGGYLLNRTLEIGSTGNGASIVGIPKLSQLIGTNPGMTVVSIDNVQSSYVIQDLWINGGGVSSPSADTRVAGVGMYIGKVVNWEFRNLYVQNCANAALILDSTQNSSFHSLFLNYAGYGLKYMNGSGNNRIFGLEINGMDIRHLYMNVDSGLPHFGELFPSPYQLTIVGAVLERGTAPVTVEIASGGNNTIIGADIWGNSATTSNIVYGENTSNNTTEKCNIGRNESGSYIQVVNYGSYNKSKHDAFSAQGVTTRLEDHKFFLLDDPLGLNGVNDISNVGGFYGQRVVNAHLSPFGDKVYDLGKAATRYRFGWIDAWNGNRWNLYRPDGSTAGYWQVLANGNVQITNSTGLACFPAGNCNLNSFGSGEFRSILTGKHRRLSKNADYTILDPTDYATTFSNFGASAMVTLTLPVSSEGVWYSGCVADADGVSFQAAGSQRIYVGSALSAAGGGVRSTTVGSCITIEAMHNGWYATAQTGTWSTF